MCGFQICLAITMATTPGIHKLELYFVIFSQNN